MPPPRPALNALAGSRTSWDGISAPPPSPAPSRPPFAPPDHPRSELPIFLLPHREPSVFRPASPEVGSTNLKTSGSTSRTVCSADPLRSPRSYNYPPGTALILPHSPERFHHRLL